MANQHVCNVRLLQCAEAALAHRPSLVWRRFELAGDDPRYVYVQVRDDGDALKLTSLAIDGVAICLIDSRL